VVDHLIIIILRCNIGSLLTFLYFQKFEMEQTTGCNSSRNWSAKKFNTSVSNSYLAMSLGLLVLFLPFNIFRIVSVMSYHFAGT